MSKADELLLSITSVDIPHTHDVTDPDPHFIIDPDTRQIENAVRGGNVLMQYDHMSEVYTFEIPRYVEGHDMLLCNRVRVHFNNVEEDTGKEHADVAELYDLATDPDNPEMAIATWTIRREATQYAGILSFLVQYECIDENGDSVYEWHTDIYSGVEVRAGRNNGEQAVIEYSNVLEQWYQRLFGAGDSVIAAIEAEGESQVAAIVSEGETQTAAVTAEGDAQKEAITLKGEETLASIPEDYTTVYNMAEEALRTKANAIELESEGTAIVVNDSSDAYLLGLNLYGETTQKTTTGKNLFDVTKVVNNSRITNNDGVVTVSTPEGSSAVDTTVDLGVLAPSLEVGTQYIFTFETTGTDKFIYLEEAKFMWTSGVAYTITQEMLDSDVLFYASGVSTTATLTNFMIRDASVTDETYEPYTGGKASPNPAYPQDLMSIESPTVDIYGSNLLNYELWKNSAIHGGGVGEYADNGVVLTADDNGDTYTNYSTSHSRINCVPGVKYILSWEHSGDVGLVYIFPKADTADMVRINTSQATYLEYIPAEGVDYFTFRVGVTPANGTAVYKNIRVNAVKQSEFEAYKEPQSFSVPHSLLGIGDAYDEVDYERGVYVQRLVRYIFDGSDDEVWSFYDAYNGAYMVSNLARGSMQYSTPLYCNYANCRSWGDNSKDTHYCFLNGYDDFVIGGSEVMALYPDVDAWKAQLATTPCEVVYQLETPIETPLTEEELAYFKRLKTNYPNTTVLNNAGARMAIKYAADTLIYLRDNQPGPTDDQVQTAVNEYIGQNGINVPTDDHIRTIVDEALGVIVNDEY